MLSGLGKRLFLVIGLVLQFCFRVWGQECDVALTCSAFGLPQHDILTTQNFTVTCAGNFMYSQVSSIKWLYTSGQSTPRPLDVDANPKLRAKGFNLELRNVSRDNEGAYFCRAEYADGTLSGTVGVGCVYIAGHAFYKTCPVTATGGENCEIPTDLVAEVGDSVDFDSRIEFRHGGLCGARQSIRLMFLRKVHENGIAENVFICSNLGRFGGNPTCSNRTRVSVSYQGSNKYDIKLRLHNLTAADSGRYDVKVDLDIFEGGRRISIFKNFTLTVPDKPTATIPAATTDTPAATDAPVGIPGCSGGPAPLLLLNGEVLSAEADIAFANISDGKQALLCVTGNENCCDNSNDGDPIAQFLAPNKTPVTEVPGSGLYVTKGKQVVRLNRRGSVEKEGSYCCSIHDSAGSKQSSCINIINN